MRHFPLILFLSPLLLAGPARAGSFTVNAHDPGADFQNLQTALDTVPPGSTLLLRSDFTGAFTIQRSLHVIGDGPGSGHVTLRGSLWSPVNFIDVVLARVNLDARGTGGSFALDTGKANRWHLDQLQIWADPAGIGATVWDDTIATFTDCVLYGPDYQQAQLYRNALASWVAPDGATYLKDCELRTLTGRPGEVYSGSLAYFCDTALLGDAAGSFTTIPETLELREWSLAIGSQGSVTAHGAPMGPALLLVSLDLPLVPQSTALGYWQLGSVDLRVPGLFDATGTWTLTADLPADPDLVGVPLFLQALDLGAGTLSCMEAGVISR